MQFDGGQVRHPDHRRKIIGQNVIDVPVVGSAPDRSGLDPVRPVLGGILFKEEFSVDSVGIALEG